MADLLRSSRLVYRAWEFPADVDFYIRLLEDTLAWSNSTLSILKPATREQLEKRVKGFAEDSLMSVIICLPEEPSGGAPDTSAEKDLNFPQRPKLIPIGSMGISTGPESMRHHRHGMIGLNIDAGYRSKGYGTEAITWCLEWGFNVAGLHRIEIGTAAFNTGATKLYDRMGFTREARKRDYLFFNGEWHDLLEWSMLEHEYREKYGKKAGLGKKLDEQMIASSSTS